MPSHPPVAPSAVSPTAAGASCSRANEREHHQSALHQRLGLVREGGEHGIVQIALPGHLNTHIVRSHWREPITTDLEIGGTITDELALTCCERTSKARYDKIRYVEDIGRRGAFVGFGNTSPCTRADVYFGSPRTARRQHKGTVAAGGSGNFSPRTIYAPAPATSRTRSRTTPTRCRARTRTC